MRHFTKLSLLALALAVAGCGVGATGPGDSGPTGSLAAALTSGSLSHDVAYFDIWLVPGGELCEADAIVQATVPLESEYLPNWVEPDAGAMHPFGDALFSGLEPGTYRVCAQPLDEEMLPSEECAFTSDGDFEVFASNTTEVVLISQCVGDPSGALDTAIALNDPPHINLIDIDPSKFILTCEMALITVDASDPNGDELTYEWFVLSTPPDAEYVFEPDGAMLYFKTITEGPYTLGVVVTDPFGAAASLSFPLHATLDGYPYGIFVNGAPMGDVDTLLGPTDIVSFYSYGAPDSASANTGIEQSDTTLVFLYEDPAGAISLSIINDETAADGDMGGGSMDVFLSGLGNATLVVPSVGDDNPGNDSYSYDDIAGTLGVDWEWNECCTDGLAITFEDGLICVDIEVSSYAGVGSTFKVLSGDVEGDIMEKPVEVLPGDILTICHCLADMEQ